MDVKIVINKKYNTQKRRAAEQCLDVVNAYMMDPPDIRAIKRPAYAEILESIGYRNIDELLPKTDVLPPLEAPVPVNKGGSA